jgi:hypothetical protein
MGDSGLKHWVSDHLYELLGFSEDALVAYVITLAKRAANIGGLVGQLEAQVGASDSRLQRIVQRMSRHEYSPIQHTYGRRWHSLRGCWGFVVLHPGYLT